MKEREVAAAPCFDIYKCLNNNFVFCLSGVYNSTIPATCCYCCCCLTSMYVINVVVSRSQASHKVRDVSFYCTHEKYNECQPNILPKS